MNISRMQTLLRLALDATAIKGLVFWPKFSVASYILASDLKRQGIFPKTVVDVGANVGQFAVSTAKLFPGVAIHSFEPVPKSYAQLRKNTANLDKIDTYNLAIGDTEGELTFNINSHSHSSSFLELADSHKIAFPAAAVERSATVVVTTLDSVLADKDLVGPTLLKVDVQGFEANVINGARQVLANTDYVVLEASFKPMYEGEKLFLELVHLMESRGFRFLRPVGAMSDPMTGEVLQIDALFAPSGSE